jgi:hypothetical protein
VARASRPWSKQVFRTACHCERSIVIPAQAGSGNLPSSTTEGTEITEKAAAGKTPMAERSKKRRKNV